eukprot:1195353-Prorocentrum_minimum.AAC.6
MHRCNDQPRAITKSVFSLNSVSIYNLGGYSTVQHSTAQYSTAALFRGGAPDAREQREEQKHGEGAGHVEGEVVEDRVSEVLPLQVLLLVVHAGGGDDHARQDEDDGVRAVRQHAPEVMQRVLHLLVRLQARRQTP